MAVIFLGILHWLEMHQLPCPVKYYLHIDCPGCGLQRSFIELVRGDFSGSFRLHPATIPLILFFLFSLFNFIYKYKKANSIVIYSYIFIAMIILTNYIYKIIFHHLA